jgi:hypothetical protein
MAHIQQLSAGRAVLSTRSATTCARPLVRVELIAVLLLEHPSDARSARNQRCPGQMPRLRNMLSSIVSPTSENSAQAALATAAISAWQATQVIAPSGLSASLTGSGASAAFPSVNTGESIRVPASQATKRSLDATVDGSERAGNGKSAWLNVAERSCACFPDMLCRTRCRRHHRNLAFSFCSTRAVRRARCGQHTRGCCDGCDRSAAPGSSTSASAIQSSQ